MYPNETTNYRKPQDGTSQFQQDVVRGLSATPKFLDAKYFYDAKGDAIFRAIMNSPEYYLTQCEGEILRDQSSAIIDIVAQGLGHFDIVELGPGDASKSIYLIKEATTQGCLRTYYPIDISKNIIDSLQAQLPKLFEISIEGLHGDYFAMLNQLSGKSKYPKMVIFLGASIGNMPPAEAQSLLNHLASCLSAQDILLIGFDLKKKPETILAAYNDAAGITRAFNLNLLARINRELQGNFNLENFRHYPIYDPGTGACKSYLISTVKQSVSIRNGYTFELEQDEPIYMEISQKYTLQELGNMASEAGFSEIRIFRDTHSMFVDCLWQKN
jgi:L-histidine N-alpha-methyltransferase